MRAIYLMFRTAMFALRRHVMRSSLTCLGIMIGIAAVIAVMEVGQGSSVMVQQTIASLGASVVQIDPSDAVKAAVSTGSGGRVNLTPADTEAILHECSAVMWAAPSLDVKAQVIYGNRNWSPNDIRGTTIDYLAIRNWLDLAEGVTFTEDDVLTAAPVCLLGQTVVRELFAGESPVGKQVRIKGVNMLVVGVLSAKGANMTGRDQDDYIIAPWTTVKYRLCGVRNAVAPAAAAPSASLNTLSQLYPTQSVQLYPARSAVQAIDMPMMVRFTDLDDIFVSANSQEELPTAIAQIKSLLRDRHRLDADDPDDFRIRDLTEIAESVAKTGQIMRALLLCVALISLAVGGVGVMNIMLASVTERTKEIGIRMAVGARPRDILRQFLIEAVLLCLVGGLAGVLLGRGVSAVVATVFSWPAMASFEAILVACAVTTCVGLTFGYYPALRASRLDPIEAMRHE